MRHQVLALSLGFLVATVAARAAEPTLSTDDEKTIYVLGQVMAQKLAPFDLKGPELEILLLGVRDGLTGATAKADIAVFGPKIQGMAQTRIEAMGKVETEASKAYLDKMAAEKGCTKSESGLLMVTLKPGTGKSPTKDDKVKVHYHGTLRDGKVFDSSVDRKEPIELSLNNVIPCWQEALPKMKVGEKARITCPATIAYGDGGSPPAIKPGAALTFEIELLDIAAGAPAAAPPAPGQ